MSNSDILRKLILYITYIIILYIIIEELYNLTKFVYEYNSAFDYGLMLRKICNNEYFEYETERFQLYNNITNLRLDNDKYNKKNYVLFILIISLIVALIISYTFANLFYHNFIEDFKNCTKFDSGIGEYSSLKKIILCFCPMCSDLSDCTLAYIIYVFILILIPLYIILKFGFNKDFEFFTNNSFKPYLIFFMILLFIIRLPLNFLDKFRFLNKNSSIFVYYLYFIIYILIFYFICNIVNYYNDYMVEYYERKDKINEETGAKFTDEEKFYNQCGENVIINRPDDSYVDIFNNVISNIFGFNGLIINQKSEDPFFDDSGIFIKDISRYIFIIGIIIIIVYLIYMILFKFKFFTYLIKSDNDIITIYNRIIIPLLSLFIILLLTNGNSLYNSYINKYVLYEPLNLYKNDLDKLYKSFELIIINDKSTLNDPKAVCKKVANAILTVLYSNIFKYNFINGYINDIDISIKKIRPSFNRKPLFIYNDDDCNKNTDTEKKYNEDNVYNIMNLIIDTQKNSQDFNIFYNNNGNVNNDILLYILLNIYPFNDLTNNKTKDDFMLFKEELINNIKAAICNVIILSKNPQGNKVNNDIDFNNLSKSNFFIKKGNISGSRENDNSIYNGTDKRFNKILNDYTYLIGDISDEYLNFMFDIYILTNDLIIDIELCHTDSTIKEKKSTLERLKDNLNKDDIKIEKIKKIYIEKLSTYIKTTFFNINELLSSNKTKRTKNALTDYIISNYNSVNLDKIYNKNHFISMTTVAKDKFDKENKKAIDTAISGVTLAETSLNTAKDAIRLNTDPSKSKDLIIAKNSAIATLKEKKEALNKLYLPITSGDLSSDPTFGDENRARKISDNANRISMSIIIIYIIYIFSLLEPFYIETFDNN